VKPVTSKATVSPATLKQITDNLKRTSADANLNQDSTRVTSL
jgi:hypothetical protein